MKKRELSVDEYKRVDKACKALSDAIDGTDCAIAITALSLVICNVANHMIAYANDEYAHLMFKAICDDIREQSDMIRKSGHYQSEISKVKPLKV